jgi:signal peptidase
MSSGDGRPPSDSEPEAATGQEEGGSPPPERDGGSPDGDRRPESGGRSNADRSPEPVSGATDGDNVDGDGPRATAQSHTETPSRADGVGDRHADGHGSGPGGVFSRIRSAEDGPFRILREVLVNVAVVVLVGMVLFAVSGVWPPMVAVESGSMEPHMHKGDLVFVTEPGRFVPDSGDARGVVTYGTARETGYRSFGSFGSVVVYDNPTRPGPPIIHRAHFWVEEGENWYPRADPTAMSADSCAETSFCPAPHAGYVTKGDNNEHYDQANGISGPVKPSWVTGVAQVRVPYLGWIRLALSTLTVPGPAPVTAGPAGETVAVLTGPVDATDVGGLVAATGSLGPDESGERTAAVAPALSPGANASPGASPSPGRNSTVMATSPPGVYPTAVAAAQAPATRAGVAAGPRG